MIDLTNNIYDSENVESTREYNFIRLSLKSKLSHRESTLLLLLTEGLLSSLSLILKKKTYLFLGKSTANSTGLLDTKISGNVLSASVVLLEL